MERGIFLRNISFAAVAALVAVVNVSVVTQKGSLVKEVEAVNTYITNTLTDIFKVVPELIGAAEASPKVLDDNVKKTDLQCMAENIYFEAATQSYVGKIAVGRVVLNRLKDAERPNTVCGVIYEGSKNTRTSTCQFSWTCQPKKVIDMSSDAWQKSVSVARELLSNKAMVDVTEGATYYHATYVSPAWRKSLRKVAQIDDHVFYK